MLIGSIWQSLEVLSLSQVGAPIGMGLEARDVAKHAAGPSQIPRLNVTSRLHDVDVFVIVPTDKDCLKHFPFLILHGPGSNYNQHYPFLLQGTLQIMHHSFPLSTSPSSHLSSQTHLFPHRDATAQPSSQGNHLGHKGLECEIFLQDNPTKDCLHFRDSRA